MDTINDFVTNIRADIRAWVSARLEWLRLETVEKISMAGAGLIFGIVVINLLFFALLFAFVALAFLFGEWLNNTAAGFALVTGIYLVLLAVMFLFRKPVINFLRNRFVAELYPDLNTNAHA